MNENERDWTVGLDWLGIGLRAMGLVVGRMLEGLVPLAYPSRPLSPHSPLPQSHPSPHSTSI